MDRNIPEPQAEPFELNEEIIYRIKAHFAENKEPSKEFISEVLDLQNEEIILIAARKFILFEETKFSGGTVIFTTQSSFLYGTEVRRTLVADIVAREYETIRKIGEKYPKEFEPQKISGWSIPHHGITHLEIIQLGEKFSIYFFNNEKRQYLINDLTQKEMELINEFFTENYEVDITTDEFAIPWSDVLLFFVGGLVLMIIGWILIVIIF